MGALDLPEESRVIDGLTYTVKPLAARKSLQVMTRVLKMVGPGFGDVVSLARAAGAVEEALATFAASLDENVLLFAVDAFAEVSAVELVPGRPVSLGNGQHDEHFRGKPVEMFAWLKFAAEVSFGPLLVAAKAKMPTGLPMASPAIVARAIASSGSPLIHSIAK